MLLNRKRKANKTVNVRSVEKEDITKGLFQIGRLPKLVAWEEG